jgi:hypothetical protein
MRPNTLSRMGPLSNGLLVLLLCGSALPQVEPAQAVQTTSTRRVRQDH